MSVKAGLLRSFRDAKAVLAESIVWDPAGDLLWCDITAGLLHRSPIDGPVDGSADTVLRLPPPLASFAPAVGGGYVASLGDRIVLVEADGAIARTLSPVPHAHDGLRLNEGKADPVGRWVTGSMNLTTGAADGALYSIAGSDEEAPLRLLRGGFGVANGTEWSADGTRIYFTDTSVKTIYQADYSITGDVTNVEAFHSGDSHDGLVIDSEGYLWSGIYGGGRVVRYSPDGAEDLTIEIPAPNITSVAFGGHDLSTLFVASARENLTEEQLVEHPLSGAIFAIDTSVHGLRPRSFGSVDSTRKDES